MRSTLGRYELCGHLAEGGMANVYLGRLKGAEGFERVVALKMLKGQGSYDANFLSMFIDEARILARLSHPGIVQIYDLGKEDGTLFLSMELLFGQSLADVWDECHARGVRLRGDVVAWIGARVAEALHYAHDARSMDGQAQNLIHRDVNPANIVVTYDGHIKLIDFGLVKGDDRLSKTELGVVKGKLAYLSPEQASNKAIDRRSDVFQLGTTLWEVSTDRRLFKRDTDFETVNAIRDAVVPDPTTLVPEYPSLLWLVLRRALEADPAQRYATAAELARDLDGVARAHGSILQTGTLAEIMTTLFAEERERETAWFKAALADEAPASLPILHPAGPRKRATPHDAAMLDSPYLVPLPAALVVQRPRQEATRLVRSEARPRMSRKALALAALVAAVALAVVIVEVLR